MTLRSLHPERGQTLHRVDLGRHRAPVFTVGGRNPMGVTGFGVDDVSAGLRRNLVGAHQGQEHGEVRSGQAHGAILSLLRPSLADGADHIAQWPQSCRDAANNYAALQQMLKTRPQLHKEYALV